MTLICREEEGAYIYPGKDKSKEGDLNGVLHRDLPVTMTVPDIRSNYFGLGREVGIFHYNISESLSLLLQVPNEESRQNALT